MWQLSKLSLSNYLILISILPRPANIREGYYQYLFVSYPSLIDRLFNSPPLPPGPEAWCSYQLSLSTVHICLIFPQAQRHVAVMGASGGIGQPLSLLCKTNPLVTKLSLYDIVHTPGVAADLSHIETGAEVTAFVGADQLEVSI